MPRLTSATTGPQLDPIRRAERCTACALYWIPASAFPLSDRQKKWTTELVNRLTTVCRQQFGVETETFLQMKALAETGTGQLHQHQVELMPMMGLSRRPGRPIPKIMTEADMQPVVQGKSKFDFNDAVADYSFWFMGKKDEKQRELFWGYGGMTLLFVKPDPKLAGPAIPLSPAHKSMPILQQFDVAAILQGMLTMQAGFGPKSKLVFGQGLEEDPQFPGLLFVAPLLESKDFFGHKPDEIAKWFELFDVYIQESPADGGILIASKHDLDDDLAAILAQMRDGGFRYPER